MTTTTATDIVRFLGLSGIAETTAGQASFPLGILYPYSQDLQRVCRCYDDLAHDDPDAAAAVLGRMGGAPDSPDPTTGTAAALLAAIATLHSRVVFAPGIAGASVAAAYRRAAHATGSPVGGPS